MILREVNSNRPTRIMKGLQKIKKEREKQIEKGYDSEHDEQHYSRELLYTAIALLLTQVHKTPTLTSDLDQWFRSLPEWMQDIVTKYENSYEDSLRVAGALIAAELNRVSD